MHHNCGIEIDFNHADSVPREDASHSDQYLIINNAGDYDLVRGTFSNFGFICFVSCHLDKCSEIKPDAYKFWARLPVPPSMKGIGNCAKER